MISDTLQKTIRHIDNFPTAGVGFKDLTPVFKNPVFCQSLVDEFVNHFRDKKIQAVLGIESRGFFLGPAIAFKLGTSFVPVRKKGKLPFTTFQQTYQLEYGEDVLEMHIDAISPGDRVLIHDDVLATGGTAQAVSRLVEKAGGIVVGFSFILELGFLNGREKLGSIEVQSLTTYN